MIETSSTEKVLHNLHGDIGLHPLPEGSMVIPKNSSKIKLVTISPKVVLQHSNVTGNSHVLRSTKANPIHHWFVNGREYVYCNTEYKICHEGPESEHGVQKVQPGIREVRHEQEYDITKDVRRDVID